MLPPETLDRLSALPRFSAWAKEVVGQESVTYMWNEEEVTNKTVERMGKMKAAAAGK